MNVHLEHSRTSPKPLDLREAPLVVSAVLVLQAFSTPAVAQTGSVPYAGAMTGNSAGSSVSASVMWATTSGGASVSSAQLHQLAGESAASVEMARKGILYLNGASIAVQAIGAQTIVSTTIIGDDNSVGVDAVQSANNTGDVSVRDVSIHDIGL